MNAGAKVNEEGRDINTNTDIWGNHGILVNTYGGDFEFWYKFSGEFEEGKSILKGMQRALEMIEV